jgi:glycosyltransferase involved in cell wall biosynthesis
MAMETASTEGVAAKMPKRRSMNPKISVIMPVLNGERYIAQALDSIAAQSCRDFEFILVDDGCTDGTRAIVQLYEQKMPIRYVNHPERKGISVSVNDGIHEARGEYISFLDHDDLWVPDLLETHAAYLDSHPEVGMVHADFQTIDPAGRIIEESVAHCRNRKRPSGNVFRELFLESFIVGSGVMIRKECFTRLGGFDESLHWGDYHMWLRIALHYKIDYLPVVLSKYRQHPTQSTRNYNTARPDADSVPMIALKKLLEAFPDARQRLGERAIRRRMASLYFELAYSWLWQGAGRNSRICLRRALRLWPMQPSYYVLYGLALLPPSMARAARGSWQRLRRLFSFTVSQDWRTQTQ